MPPAEAQVAAVTPEVETAPAVVMLRHVEMPLRAVMRAHAVAATLEPVALAAAEDEEGRLIRPNTWRRRGRTSAMNYRRGAFPRECRAAWTSPIQLSSS